MPHQRGQWGKKKIKARASEKKTRSALTAHLPSLRFLFSSSLPPSSLGISKLGEDDADVDGKEDGRRLQLREKVGFSLSLSLSLSRRFSISLFRFSDFHFLFPISYLSAVPISYSLFALYLGYFHSSLPGDFLLNVVSLSLCLSLSDFPFPFSDSPIFIFYFRFLIRMPCMLNRESSYWACEFTEAHFTSFLFPSFSSLFCLSPWPILFVDTRISLKIIAVYPYKNVRLRASENETSTSEISAKNDVMR